VADEEADDEDALPLLLLSRPIGLIKVLEPGIRPWLCCCVAVASPLRQLLFRVAL
jgi:hypothetical protein